MLKHMRAARLEMELSLRGYHTRLLNNAVFRISAGDSSAKHYTHAQKVAWWKEKLFRQ